MAGQDLTSKSMPLSFKGFNGGLNNTASPLTVADNEASKIQNIDFDRFGSVLKRSGYTPIANASYGGSDAYNTLLLHMDGTNDSETITDSSSRANTVTNVANAKIKTAVKKFGSGSLLLNGTTQYATVPSDQKLTNGSFETWTGLTDLLTNGNMEAGSPPSSWTVVGAGATWAREATIIKEGSYSGKLTRAGTDCYVQQLGVTITNDTAVYVLGGWVYKGNAAAAIEIQVAIAGSTTMNVQVSGAVGWHFVTGYITNSNKVAADVYLTNRGVDGDAYFDSFKFYKMLAPTDWTLAGAGATVAREEGTVKVGSYAAKLTRNGADAYMIQTIAGWSAWANKTVTTGMWIWASVANRARFLVTDGVSNNYSAYHTGDSTWQYITYTKVMAPTTSVLNIYLFVDVGDTTAYFDGAFVTDDAVANFNFGSGDWTIDTQAYPTSFSGNVTLFYQQDETISDLMVFYADGNGSLIFLKVDSSGTTIIASATNALTLNIFQHIELVRYGNTFKIRVNGVDKTSSGGTYSGRLPDYSGVFMIGTFAGGSSSWNGYLDEFRISKGIARHTADFTVPNGPYNTLTAAPQVTGLHWYEPSTSTDALVATIGDQIYSNDLTSTLTSITGGLTVTPTYLWKFVTFLNTTFATNGIDAPWKWTGTGDAALMTLPTDITLPKYITQFQAYLLVADSVVGGVREKSRLNWGVINQGDTWLDTDFAYISRNDGQDITGLAVLGDRVVIFKDRSIWIGQFTGDVDVPFQFQKTQSHVGCASGYSIQNVANGLVFMGEDGIYFFDGNQSERISNRINESFNLTNRVRNSYICSMYQKYKNRTWFSTCASGDTDNSGVIYWDDYNNAFGVYSGMNPSAMAMVYNSGSEIPVFGDYDGYIYKADTGVDDYPLNVRTAIDAYFYTKWMDYSDLVNSKGLVQLDTYFKYDNATLTVVYAYNFADGDTYTLSVNTSGGTALWDYFRWDVDTWGGSGGGHYRLDLTGRGRVVRIGFKNNILGETFRVDGIGQLVHLETNQ